jgi:uncharacterized protein (DUF427 family)
MTPGPDHPITVTPTAAKITVSFQGQVIATSTQALTLQESTYPAVQYIPREDVDPSVLVRTDSQTYCPFKGDASYFSLKVGETTSADAIWTYEAPYDAVASIKDHLAFYPDRVEITSSAA